MAGFNFTQLPAAEVSPETELVKQIETGRKSIQQKYALQWQTVNSNARTLGPEKHRAMLGQIDANAKAEMLDFNQRAEQQLEELRRVDRIASAGGITPETQDKLKATRVYGSDIAGAMYPESKSVPQIFGTLDAYDDRLTRNLGEYRMTKERVPALLARKGKMGWPLPKEGVAPGNIQVWDRGIIKEDKKTKEITMGDWRDATPEEVQERTLLIREQARIRRLKAEILGHPNVKNRLAQPGTPGGTFGDKIAASYDKPKQNADPLGLFD